jgi:hypothetical protein
MKVKVTMYAQVNVVYTQEIELPHMNYSINEIKREALNAAPPMQNWQSTSAMGDNRLKIEWDID